MALLSLIIYQLHLQVIVWKLLRQERDRKVTREAFSTDKLILHDIYTSWSIVQGELLKCCRQL